MDHSREAQPLSVNQLVRNRVSNLRSRYGLSLSTRSEMRRERSSENSSHDAPADCAISEGLAWIARAQDASLSRDGGVARQYCLVNGWSASYPETTGYIIPTIIREARLSGDIELRDRAKAMLDWLVRIQMPSGAFQGGTVFDSPVVPVTFNTGQILMGLAAGAAEFGSDYRTAMIAAADWMAETQDPDGCWRKYPSPFVRQGDKTYDVHAAWGLFEAARLEPSRGYAEAAMRNVYWALSQQNRAGWFANCCLTDAYNPLTHTLGYALRGLVEGFLFTGDKKIFKAAMLTAEGALRAVQPNGFLPGRVDSSWQGTVSWCCLTGSAQIAICWLLLFLETGDVRFRDAAMRVNSYVRRTVRFDGPPETRGAVKGSFPVAGEYVRFQYPNWACKFFIDANRLERAVSEEKGESSVLLQVRAACPAD